MFVSSEQSVHCCEAHADTEFPLILFLCIFMELFIYVSAIQFLTTAALKEVLKSGDSHYHLR